jgi:hypothetical protein
VKIVSRALSNPLQISPFERGRFAGSKERGAQKKTQKGGIQMQRGKEGSERSK